MMESRGVCKYVSGDVYDGEWKANLKEGRGIYKFADGGVYDGEWKASLKEGLKYSCPPALLIPLPGIDRVISRSKG